ncbi:hypothetical protein TNCV_1301651 [Trichonephila clavipes]|nr:hypothetical protein TNCV_1301651 [Trichonephila clavipes]
MAIPRKDISNQHVDILSDNKPEFCEKCHMTFHQDVDFRAHLRLHSTEKIFVCDICKLTFSCDSDLKTIKSRKHLTTHTRHLRKPRKRLTVVANLCNLKTICKENKTFSGSDTSNLKGICVFIPREKTYSCS